MRIDFHSHLYPAEFLDLMVRLGREDLARTMRQPLDMSARIADQDAAGVDCQALSFIGINSIVDNPSGATDAAQCLNDLYAGVCADNPGRFLAFAMLPLPHVDRSIEEARRAMKSPTCLGVGVPCFVGGVPLDDPRFDELWAELNGLDTVVFVHPVGSESDAHPGIGDWGMGAMFGSPLQLGVAACRLVFSGLTARYPRLTFIFAQAGGFLPARWEAIENLVLKPGLAGHAAYVLGWVNDLDLDPAEPMAGFRSFLYDTATFDRSPTTLATARSTFGVDRLVLGSDATFGSLTGVVSFLETTDGLSDPERSAVLDGWAHLHPASR